MDDFADLFEADRTAISKAMRATFYAGADESLGTPAGKAALSDRDFGLQ
jgi:hypothetical protein